MNRRLTSWALRIVLVLVTAAVLSFAACGGGGGGDEQASTPGDETAGVKPEDLDVMMLQADDLASGFSYEVSGEVSDLAGLGEAEEQVAGRHLRSLLEESMQEEGKTVCIVSDLELYANEDAAAARLAEEWGAVERIGAALPAEQGVPEKLDLPTLGDQVEGFFLSAPRVSFCGWEAVAAEVVSLTFRKGRLLADVRTYTLGEGASTDEAVELARKLLARIEAGLSEE
jgi:hypothetical protein